MTRKIIHEYAEGLRPRYLAASREGKKTILVEFCATTGYHHKAAISPRRILDEQHSELKLEPEVREQLLRVSPSTIGRLLKPYRMPSWRRPYTQSLASNAIKDQVPIRTFRRGEWRGTGAGGGRHSQDA